MAGLAALPLAGLVRWVTVQADDREKVEETSDLAPELGYKH